MIKIFITCKLKNTLITITKNNNIIFKTSSKSFDLKSKYKNNPYIFKIIINHIIKKLSLNTGIIYIKGYGPGRYTFIKLLSEKIKILSIFDISNIPFNGCRLKKLLKK